ncbi:2610_t:CDS:2, partial [Cetraspora pellucida]
MIDNGEINISSDSEIDDDIKTILNGNEYQLLWVLCEKFENVRRIGQGGSTTVYYATWLDRQHEIWKKVALKLFHGSKSCRKEFLKE